MMGESIVLVITPSPDMTNKIQQTLDNIGGYIVISSSTPTEALELTQKSIINACILDIFHPDFPVLPVVKELKNKQPEMRLILILSNHGLSLQDIPGIIPDGFLPRSFNTIQLMSALGHTPKISMPPKPSSSLTSQTIPGSSHKPASQDPLSNPLPFSKSEDFTNLSQRLSNLSTETNALAVIILRRKQLLSHVGTLPYAAIQELVDLINSYSRVSAQNLQKQLKPGQSKSGNGDMIRFIQLQSIQGRYLLYVISLTKEMLLALLFDQDTQFSKVRRQTILISHELLTPQRSVPLEYRPSSPDIERQAPAQPTDLTPAEEIFELSETQPTSPLTEPKVEQPPDTTGVPTPSATKPPEFDKEEIGTISPPGMTTPDAGMDKMGAQFGPLEPGRKIGYHDSAELDDQGFGEPLGFMTSGKEQTSRSGAEYDSTSSLETRSFGNNITYSCLLIPRMPTHLLTSNLASYLFKWMGQLCLAYGWRLEHLSIHSNHIQMIAGAPLTISPAFLVRTLRQKTSQYIFTQFPLLANENPSGDFWAPGFFISGGKQTIQPHLIDRYISEIREHQGVYNSSTFL